MSFGVVTYDVDENVSQPFAPLGFPVKLYNLGPGNVIVSTRRNVRVGQPYTGFPLHVGASVEWDGDKECHAVTSERGERATIAAIDLSGST